jgi:hypothetical protein
MNRWGYRLSFLNQVELISNTFIKPSICLVKRNPLAIALTPRRD